MKIWSKYIPTGKVEQIDSCDKRDANYIVKEYQIAFGRDWKVWAGNKNVAA